MPEQMFRQIQSPLFLHISLFSNRAFSGQHVLLNSVHPENNKKHFHREKVTEPSLRIHLSNPSKFRHFQNHTGNIDVPGPADRFREDVRNDGEPSFSSQEKKSAPPYRCGNPAHPDYPSFETVSNDPELNTLQTRKGVSFYFSSVI